VVKEGSRGTGMEAGGGIEPPIEDLQSPALPLCYPAGALSPVVPLARLPAPASGSGSGPLRQACRAVNTAGVNTLDRRLPAAVGLAIVAPCQRIGSSPGMDYSSARRNMVDNQLRTNRIEDPNLLAAMLEVPRERFVPKTLRGVAYLDEDLLLSGGLHLIEPLALARLIQMAEVTRDDVALVLGCGTGYTAAVVGRLSATTMTIIRDEVGARQVESLLDDLKVDNVVVRVGEDSLAGAPDQAPFDVIILAGSVEVVPDALLAQLGDHGRLAAVVDGGRIGKGTLCTRVGGTTGSRVMFDARIPPLPGVRHEPAFVF
jgi:protein-L-isoaspartate(D-aspartate) O-methyltransferase